MRLSLVLICLLTLPVLCFGQQLQLVTPLNAAVHETSGLIYLRHKIITHNDSGWQPALLEIDSLTGQVTRRVTISNTTNVDWEDICHDAEFIYIGDFGNNNGNRTNLRIYRIPIAAYFAAGTTSVAAEIIKFSYADQTDYSAQSLSTNFDAEAFIARGDSLFLFTKNWGNSWSNVYALPKAPGTYTAHKIDSINTNGLVTSAAYQAGSDRVLLTGYSFTMPFVVELSRFRNGLFSNGKVVRHQIRPPAGYSTQIEAIAILKENHYFLTAEGNDLGKVALYSLQTDNLLGIDAPVAQQGMLYPNPATDRVHLAYDNLAAVEVYDARGVLCKTASTADINLTGLGKGVYFLLITDKRGNLYPTRKLILQ
ncbi:T9SS type A sorting domain-containing protein [Pontibacter sp. CAU 1760]